MKFIDNRNHLYALCFHPIEMENLSYCYVLLRRLELLVYVVFPFMELKNQIIHVYFVIISTVKTVGRHLQDRVLSSLD